MMSRCVIVAGGDCDFSHFTELSGSDYIIAADSGLRHTNNIGITPNLIVGDFDSFTGELPNDIETFKLPTHKDDTDLLFALRCGVERGFESFLVLGGYGSRPDQNIAMLQSLKWVAENSSAQSIKAVCNGFEVSVIRNSSVELQLNRSRYLSVFCLGEQAKGVTITGADYFLDNATVTSSFPIGVSNEGDGKVKVSVGDGILFILTVDKDI